MTEDKGTGTGRDKGFFSAAGLQVAKRYVFPRRPPLLTYGVLGVTVLALAFAIDQRLFDSRFASGGPLTSAHADFESDCMQCHVPGKAVIDAKCSVCHEKTADASGVYNPAAHAVYRSGDATRAANMPVRGHVFLCADCHDEHGGRDARITHVDDRMCLGCHETGSFDRSHPQFQCRRDSIPDDAGLQFTHRRHTDFVMTRIGEPNVEQACVYCHVPEPDGRRFQRIDYDRHCAACHDELLKVAPLPVRDPGRPNDPGVETLDMIRARGGPGTIWTLYTSPAEFRMIGDDKVRKSPVYHEDPWVLENLRQIRRRLYGDVGLADLLRLGAGGSAPVPELYDEALASLEAYAMGLRGRSEPEIRAELAWVDSLVAMARARVRGGAPAAAAAAFTFDPTRFAAGSTPAERDGLMQLAAALVDKCTLCHILGGATLARVQTSQAQLARAEFDHRAHVFERRCLECHTTIPVTDAMLAGAKFTPAMDEARIQNLPGIENCRECHRAGRVSNTCTTCHLYHPNKTERGNLLLFRPASATLVQ